jgi:hypothetical protein
MCKCNCEFLFKCELCELACSGWAGLSGLARHGWALVVPCSDRGDSPSGGTARPGYQAGLKRAGLKWARLKRARAGPGRAARLDIYRCRHAGCLAVEAGGESLKRCNRR